jgi:dTDP-4-amino-4,6-dideoxygalactose transaminase
MTFCASVNAIIHAGATPVLADVDPRTMNIDPARVAEKITPRTKAIMPVHFAGRACDMDALMALAKQHDLMVIEDCAHAIETRYKAREAGLFGEFGCFSFYVTKNVITGEGGMVLTKDEALAARIKVLALHGMSNDAWDRYTERGSWAYRVLAAGYNYAMSDYQAALGHAQFSRLDEFQRQRTHLARQYNERFAALPEIVRPIERNGTTHAWHLYVARIRPEMLTISRDEFISAMGERGIGTSVHFIPIHHHPSYRETYGWAPGDFPVADEAFQTMISLPLYTRMTDAEVDRVSAAVEEIVRGHRN